MRTRPIETVVPAAALSGPAIQGQLAALLPHDRAVVEWRLSALREFWALDQARGGIHRCKTRAAVAAAISAREPKRPMSATRLRYWEQRFLRFGVAGLVSSRRYGRVIGMDGER